MPTKEQDYGLAVGGLIIHEAGATRMGDDPKTSVLNTYCQAHEVKNVFVNDGGPFVSQADKNLTWTIIALSGARPSTLRRSGERETSSWRGAPSARGAAVFDPRRCRPALSRDGRRLGGC